MTTTMTTAMATITMATITILATTTMTPTMTVITMGTTVATITTMATMITMMGHTITTMTSLWCDRFGKNVLDPVLVALHFEHLRHSDVVCHHFTLPAQKLTP